MRGYGQFCGIARALDVLGDRWTLLVVRELLTGPKRYRDLQSALPGIGTNLLAARLRALRDAGVVESVVLPAPSRVPAYALTPRGRDLEPILLHLSRWGRPLLPEPAPASFFRAGWGALAIRALFDPQKARGLRASIELLIGDEPVTIRIDRGRVETREGPEPDARARIRIDRATALRLAAGRADPRAEIAAGRIRIEGDRRVATRFFRAVG